MTPAKLATMNVRRVGDDELATLAALAAPLQADGRSHVAYLAVEADDIRAELEESTWATVSAVDVDAGGRVVAWLIGDIENDIGRVMWLGPFVASGVWAATASRLLAAARDQLPASVTEEELAVDGRFESCRAWAVTEGFAADEGSYVLTLDGPLDPPATSELLVREIRDEDHGAVVRLHEDMFPGTHTTGLRLVAGHDERHRRLVAEQEGEVVGYVAVEIQADGSGYIDFVGVDPAARRSGVGGALVRAGVAELRSSGAVSIGLTVREGSDGARELYASLGFREERFIVPLRRGFSLA